ncbi:putative DNA mismatch repair protein [Rhodotorula toruloides ATCC 204091]|uniref:BY PROTMAP: gi/342320435/gb/EGU12375.1/ putative DNA mismatch repair protein [Rhodotorula glutinis ATCC 204091] n=1 Tax=Rhodotorula toruloides TaxID=5286 RepID=A0A0K3CGM4_RHOTO|nr:putative DNA mismatch repair protein [Rhodotorula toruloides ATCC 204091]KAK4332729.1 putative DNA mismatch repair protein [Rhodotorula toruloides]
MPTARAPPPPPTAWPAYYPPSLRYLSDPRPHPDPSKLPPSRRYRSQASGVKVRTMQDELDQLDVDEDELYNAKMDTRQYGYSWLVPLGRQNTHEEDIESQYGSSPHASRLADPLNLDGDFDFDFPYLRHGADGPGEGGAGRERFGVQRGLPQEEEDADVEVRDLDDEIEDADAASQSESGEEDGEDGEGEASGAGSEMMSEAGDANVRMEERWDGQGERQYRELPGDGGSYM